VVEEREEKERERERERIRERKKERNERNDETFQILMDLFNIQCPSSLDLISCVLDEEEETEDDPFSLVPPHKHVVAQVSLLSPVQSSGDCRESQLWCGNKPVTLT
jgi:hypothetical protein